MRRVDYITYDDEGEEQLTAGVGLVDGKLQRIEGDAEFADILLSNAMLQDEPPEVQMEAWSSLYNNQLGFATEPYDDDDENYGPDGMFIGGDLPDGVEFAFCPTGPGGGQDNSCGGPGGGKVDTQKLKDDIAALETKRQHVVNQIKEAKASGKPFSALKKQRATLNKQITDKQNELSDHLKGKMAPAPNPQVKGKLDEDAVAELVMVGAKAVGFKLPAASQSKFVTDVKLLGAKVEVNAHGVKVTPPIVNDHIEDPEAAGSDFWSNVVSIGNMHGAQLSKLAGNAGALPPAVKPAAPKAPEATHPPDAFVDSKGNPTPGSGLTHMASTTAEAHYQGWAAKLEASEASAIKGYTGSGYHGINKGLRQGLLNDYLQKQVDQLDAAFEKAPPLPKSIVVHRGVHAKIAGAEVFDQMKPGDLFMERGYVSTSLAKGSAFAGSAKLNIKVPAGAKAAYVSGFGLGISKEKELLLPRDSKFKVLRSYEQHGVKVIDVELIK